MIAYTLNDLDELQEYMWLKPSVTHIDFDIFVDDGGSYMRHNHQLLLFVRNGYSRDCNDFIPVSIDENPCVLADMDIKIPYDVVVSIKDFIKSNLEILKDLANCKISQEVFVEKIK